MSNKGTKKRKSIIKVGSNITIGLTADLLKNYLTAIKKNSPVTVKSTLIENIDLSGIQLLLLIKKHAKDKIPINFDLKFSDSATEVLNKSGFSELLQS